ncbi:MAG: phenylalanine--tRNA ligase subunit beta, partial [Candidatus Aenigmarchaeota archaeon]|nr:phenylalanine--tRNA ligase subunit beta [Candidatus Aenigmarchaeota archaeon]
MPTLTFKKSDLFEIIGKKFNDEELEEIINSLKPEVEEVNEEEIKIEVTAERADLFSVEGLGNAIRNYLGISKYKTPKLRRPKLSVKVRKVRVRPYIAAAIIKNVKMSDSFIRSLMNVQEVLHKTVGRNREKVAIGIHDLDKIRPPISYELAESSEKMVPLGEKEEMSLEEILTNTEKGKEYSFILENKKKYPVYRDRNGIFSFPPILNSERTKVTEKTKNLFVELTGTDMNSVLQTLNLLTYFFSVRGFKVEQVKIKGEYNLITPKFEKRTVLLTSSEVNNLLGLKLNNRQIASYLKKMGYRVKIKKNKILVEVPFYRVDILHKVDIIEDVAIGYGIENIEPELPSLFTKGMLDKTEEISGKIRDLVIGLGFQEVMRFVLT